MKIQNFRKTAILRKKWLKLRRMQITRIFHINFEGFKMVFWKKFWREKLFILIVFIDCLYFFWFMIIQKAQKLSWKMRKMLFFKNPLTKCMTIVANLQQMLQNILSTIFWYLNSSEISFWRYGLQSSKKKHLFTWKRNTFPLKFTIISGKHR